MRNDRHGRARGRRDIALPGGAFLAGCALVVAAQAPRPARAGEARVAPRSTVVGTLETHPGIASAELPAPRRLFVLLPPDYDAKRRYPVVYVPDGQDLFDAASAAGGDEWGLDELLAAHPPGIAAVIVVGIEAAPDALREYALPGSRDGARGDAYVRLLTDVIQPFIDKHYATAAKPAGACVLGDGAGATLALYAAWTRPDRFGTGVAIELPDQTAAEWPAVPARRARPHLWIEQVAADVAERPSATAFLTKLETGAVVQYVIAGPRATRIAGVAAGLRAAFPP